VPFRTEESLPFFAVILEILEWCATPAGWSARWSGLLSAQIAIRHRKARCREAWHPHLEACKAFVAQHRTPEEAHGRPRGHLVILGSGHLNDFDLAFLQPIFARLTLVDAVHPIEIQAKALTSRGRLRLVTTDLSDCREGTTGALGRLMRSADWAVSSCLLSQLTLHAPPARIAQVGGAKRVYAAHWDLLREARNALLITDMARRASPAEKWTPLWEDFPLPVPLASWVWTLSPPGELGGTLSEERRVEAFRLAPRHAGGIDERPVFYYQSGQPVPKTTPF
jgi:hypothetical protein